MGREFVEKVEASPIIAAIKNDEELENCLKSEIDVAAEGPPWYIWIWFRG